jgi:predicted permease
MWLRTRRPRLRDELQFHRDRLIAEYRSAGLDAREAERRAFLEFGNVPVIEEASLDARGRWLGDFGRDLRYTARTIRRDPGFTLFCILSLALGIGANIAIFNVLDAVMFRPLQVDEADRLVQIGRVSDDGRPRFVPFPVFEHVRDGLGLVSETFAQLNSNQTVLIGGEDDPVNVDAVSGAYFDVLRLRPAAGRLFGSIDDSPAAETAVAVITDAYWRRRFGGDAGAVGMTVTIRGRPFTIVGITRPGFTGAQAGRTTDLIVPLQTMLNAEQRTSLGMNSLAVLARLRPDTTLEHASAQVSAMYAAFMRARADEANLTTPEREEVLRQRATAFAAAGGFTPLRGEVGKPLLILMGIAGFILLLACVNLSGLFLARAEARQREVSIRLAIGAGRARVLRQFLTETLMLALPGGLVGLALAAWLGPALFGLLTGSRDIALTIAPDTRVIVFAAAVSLATCLVCGFLPALQASRTAISPAIKEVRATRRGRLGPALVVIQVAVSMVLVVAASLFVGTLANLYAVDRGFDSSGVLVLQVRTAAPYPADRVVAVHTALLERLRALPDAESVSAASILPVSGALWDRSVQVEGYLPRADEPNVGFNVVAPGYFETLRIPLLAGREFEDRDGQLAPKVAVVNESFVRYFFKDQSAIGRRVTSVGATYEIVGVARDTTYQDLRSDKPRTLYVSSFQHEDTQPTSYSYVLRLANGNPLRLVPGLDRFVREADSALRVRTTMTYDALVDRSISAERMVAFLAGLFGVLALLVAGLGIFGVLAFRVARRTNELGLRLVLGATRASVMGIVLRDVAIMLATGLVIGGATALTMTGLARGILFGLTPTDSMTFAIAGALLTVAACTAAWMPARRAARVDPLTALRQE